MSYHKNNTAKITTADCKGKHSLSDMEHANGEAALVRKPINMSTGKEYKKSVQDGIKDSFAQMSPTRGDASQGTFFEAYGNIAGDISVCYEKCRYAFFPGCQLGAAEPEIVIKAYDSIRFQHPDTAIFLRCCGAPAKFAGSDDAFSESIKAIRDGWESLGKPTLITACTSCIEILKKELPQISIITIYEFLRDSGISGGCNSVDYSLLKSHANTDGGASDDIIKELAEGMGVKLHSPDEDGYPYITDCIDCRDAIKRSGKDAVHILELIYGMGDSNTHMIHEHDHDHDEGPDEHDAAEATECDGNCADCTSLCSEYSYAAPSELPSHDRRLANRTELKETLLALFWNEL